MISHFGIVEVFGGFCVCLQQAFNCSKYWKGHGFLFSWLNLRVRSRDATRWSVLHNQQNARRWSAGGVPESGEDGSNDFDVVMVCSSWRRTQCGLLMNFSPRLPHLLLLCSPKLKTLQWDETVVSFRWSCVWVRSGIFENLRGISFNVFVNGEDMMKEAVQYIRVKGYEIVRELFGFLRIVVAAVFEEIWLSEQQSSCLLLMDVLAHTWGLLCRMLQLWDDQRYEEEARRSKVPQK